MPLPVVYRRAASIEILNTARRYELERPGLGTAFLDEVTRLEGHISDPPALYQIIDDEVRRAVLRRLPFGLFYVAEAERVLVLACLDLRRDPAALGDIVGRRQVLPI
ncbi:MAG TPA: hypothetical protein VEP47_15225 [Reyranella sp.]|nr:hypothetical protein [Reyranella sp.]